MTKRIVHEIKIPKSVTIALYAVTIAIAANFFKPIVAPGAAWALGHSEEIIVNLKTVRPLMLDLD